MRTRSLFDQCLQALDDMTLNPDADLPVLNTRYQAAFASYTHAARTEADDTLQTGIVAVFNPRTDCGFIRRTGKPDLFFVGRDLFGDITRAPLPGDRVTFEEQVGPQIKQAIHICNHACPASQAEFDTWNTPAQQAARADARAVYTRVDAFFEDVRRRRYARRTAK
jgi:cold shock CspA family protein